MRHGKEGQGHSDLFRESSFDAFWQYWIIFPNTFLVTILGFVICEGSERPVWSMGWVVQQQALLLQGAIMSI